MAYMQRVFNKHNPATKTLSLEKRGNAQARIFKLLQQKQFAEKLKSQDRKKYQKNRKILHILPFIDQQGHVPKAE